MNDGHFLNWFKFGLVIVQAKVANYLKVERVYRCRWIQSLNLVLWVGDNNVSTKSRSHTLLYGVECPLPFAEVPHSPLRHLPFARLHRLTASRELALALLLRKLLCWKRHRVQTAKRISSSEGSSEHANESHFTCSTPTVLNIAALIHGHVVTYQFNVAPRSQSLCVGECVWEGAGRRVKAHLSTLKPDERASLIEGFSKDLREPSSDNVNFDEKGLRTYRRNNFENSISNQQIFKITCIDLRSISINYFKQGCPPVWGSVEKIRFETCLRTNSKSRSQSVYHVIAHHTGFASYFFLHYAAVSIIL